MNKCRFENIFVLVRLRIHANLLIIFSQSVSYKTEPESEELIRYCCGTPNVNKLVVNPTVGLYKSEENKHKKK